MGGNCVAQFRSSGLVEMKLLGGKVRTIMDIESMTETILKTATAIHEALGSSDGTIMGKLDTLEGLMAQFRN